MRVKLEVLRADILGSQKKVLIQFNKDKRDANFITTTQTIKYCIHNRFELAI